MRGRYQGYNLRVGILRNRLHRPAAPKSAGRVSVLGGPARKTLQSRRDELRKQAKKLRVARGKKGEKNRTKKKIILAKIRSASRTIKQSERITVREVARQVRRSSGVNFWRRPFKDVRSRAYRAFMKAFMFAAARNRSMGKVEKLLLDVVRLPILQKKYGKNRPETRENKGFDRRFVDTGQMILGMSSQIRKRGGN